MHRAMNFEGTNMLSNVIMSLNCARFMISGITNQELKITENICLQFQSAILRNDMGSLLTEKSYKSLDKLVYECTKA